jgi:hypothetical protein
VNLAHLLFLLTLFLSHLSEFFSQTAGKLHTARLARLYELAGITGDSPTKSSLLLGIDSFNRIIGDIMSYWGVIMRFSGKN